MMFQQYVYLKGFVSRPLVAPIKKGMALREDAVRLLENFEKGQPLKALRFDNQIEDLSGGVRPNETP